VARWVRPVALSGVTIGFSLLLEQNFRSIYAQTVYYTWCTITEPWAGWLHVAALSGALFALSTLHILLRLPTRRLFGVTSLAVIFAMTLWVGLWGLVTIVLSSDAPLVLSSPTAIPFVQGTATVATLGFGRRRRRQIIVLGTALIGLPALWIVVNFLVARVACGQL